MRCTTLMVLLSWALPVSPAVAESVGWKDVGRSPGVLLINFDKFARVDWSSPTKGLRVATLSSGGTLLEKSLGSGLIDPDKLVDILRKAWIQVAYPGNALPGNTFVNPASVAIISNPGAPCQFGPCANLLTAGDQYLGQAAWDGLQQKLMAQ